MESKPMLYKFDHYVVNDQNRTLFDGKEIVQLSAKMYQLLSLFIHNAGDVIKKKQIYEQVWAGKIVSDSTLYKLIELLRTKLNDSKDNPKYIHTIHGEGYLFTDIVKKVEEIDKPKKIDKTSAKKSLYILPIIGLLIFLTIQFFAQSTEQIFDSIDVDVKFAIDNDINEPITKGLNTFVKDLLSNGVQNLKSLNQLPAKNSNPNLLVQIIFGKVKNLWSAQLKYINTKNNKVDEYKLSDKNFDALMIKLVDQIKSTPLTKTIVEHSSHEFSTNTQANILHIRALTENQLGNYQNGKKLLLEVLEIDEKYLMAKLDLAISERNLSDLDKSLAIINSLLILKNNLFFQLKISKIKGNILLTQNRFKETKEYYFLALELANDLNHLQQEISLSLNLGMLYQKLGEYSESIETVSNSIEKSKKANQTKYLGHAHAILALTYSTINNVDEAILQTKNSIPLFEAQKNHGELARSHMRLAWLYLLQLDTQKYVKFIQLAENQYQSSDYRQGLENIIFLQFLHALYSHQFDVAEQLLNRHERINEEIKKPSSQMRFYRAQALYAQYTKNYDFAFSYYIKYQELVVNEKLVYDQFMSLLYLCEIEIMRNKKVAAKEFLELALSKEIPELKEEFQYRQGLYILQFEEDKDKGQKLLQQSIKISQEKGNLLLVNNIQSNLEAFQK